MKYTFKQFTKYAALSEEERTQEKFDEIFPMENLDEGFIDDIAQKAGEVVGKAAKAVGFKSELEKSKERLQKAKDKRAAAKKAMDQKINNIKSFDDKAMDLKKKIGATSAAIEKDRAALKRATMGKYSDSQFARDLLAQQNESFIETLNAVVEGYINIDEFIAEAKSAVVYEITKTKKGKEYKKTGTLQELIDTYSYELETGQSYEKEKGNKKINLKPTTIKALVDNLSKAADNAAANGYSGVSFSYKEVTPKEIKESVQETKNISVADFLEAVRDEVIEEFNLSEDQVQTIHGLVVDKIEVVLEENAVQITLKDLQKLFDKYPDLTEYEYRESLSKIYDKMKDTPKGKKIPFNELKVQVRKVFPKSEWAKYIY